MKRFTSKLTQKAIVLIIIGALLVLTGCSNAANKDSSTATSETGSATSTKSGGTVVIGITATNLPVADTLPTEGFEGFRFVSYQLYDGLIKWDLTKSDKTAELIPGLAESWETSKTDPTLWTFHLRKNVTFHDGTPFNADSVIFAFERILNAKSPNFNTQTAGGSGIYSRFIDSYKKLDDFTVTIKTKMPYSFLLYDLAMILIPSPDAVKKSGVDFTNHPVGTGPFKFGSLKPGQEMVLEKNESYWGTRAKLDKVVLRPISDPSARLAALQSGEIDWAEVPPTESVEPLKGAGFQVLTNPYPHSLPYVLNTKEGPWSNKLVRQAANYAIDREGISKDLLNGASTPATQFVYKGNPWYSDKAPVYNYDPEKAKQLLAQAGYPNGFETSFLIPSGGSGNMWPIPMSEYVQKNLKAVGINVKMQSVEWQTLFSTWFQVFAKDKKVGGIMISLPSVSPSWFSILFTTMAIPPNGINAGSYSNPKVDEIMEKAGNTFDNAQRDSLLRDASAIIADDAPWLFLVHDLNLRALSPKVQGFVQPQSWFADLTSISMK